jgi:hypothetical protein
MDMVDTMDQMLVDSALLLRLVITILIAVLLSHVLPTLLTLQMSQNVQL